MAVIYNSVQYATLFCLTMKTTCLLLRSMNYYRQWWLHKLWRKWRVVNTTPGTVFTTLHFLHNLQMGPMSWRRLCRVDRGQTLYFIGPSHKLQIKWRVVNTTPVTVFTTLYFLHNLRMGPVMFTLHKAEKSF